MTNVLSCVIVYKQLDGIGIKMDMLTHTLIAVGSLAVAYYAGAYLKSRDVFESCIAKMLDKLERDGFIATKLDKDGDKELILISEIVAKALKNSK